MDFDDLDPFIKKVIQDALQERIENEIAKKDPLLIARHKLMESRELFKHGRYEEALKPTEYAIKVLEELSGEQAEFLLGQGYNNLAEAQRNLGMKKEALSNYDKALQLVQKFGDKALLATVLSNRGIMLLGLGRVQEAIASHQMALKYDQETNNLEGQGFSHHNLAYALYGAGDIESALPHAKKAVEIREKLKDYDELMNSYSLLASILNNLKKIKPARKYLQKALSLKSKLKNPFSIRQPLGTLVEILSESGEKIEYLKALEQLINEVEKLRVTIQDSKTLEKFDSRYNRHYLTAIEANLDARKYDRALVLIEKIQARSFSELFMFKKYGRSLQSKIDDFDPNKVKEALESNEVLIEFWIYPKKVYRFLFTHNKGPIIDITEETPGDFYSALQALIKPGMLQDNNAKTLNKTLIKPLEEFVKAGSRIYMVPHGMQFYLPFAAIRHERGTKYLCETNEIVIIPSASFLPLFKTLPKVRSKQSLVIGDPDGSLRHARKEANEVARLLDCEPLIGDAASKDRVLSTLKSGEFDVIHFACHWHENKENREQSGFVMADKEVITINDIADINFRANLVSIASCWSGIVEFSPSNNFAGMPKVLILSGANCVISSISPLDDESSSLMFQGFYNGYRKEGESVVRALTQSQRFLMKSKSFSDPKFWASLYVTGKDITYEK